MPTVAKIKKPKKDDVYVPVLPTGFRVLVRQDPVEMKSEGGIILGDSDRRQAGQIWGTIVAVGPKAFTGADFGDDEHDKHKAGTRVLYKRYGGQSFTDVGKIENGRSYHLVPDSEVLGIVNTDKELNLVESH